MEAQPSGASVPLEVTRHGGGPQPASDDVPWDDVDLALVHADMHAYSLLHPCECEARCCCEDDDG